MKDLVAVGGGRFVADGDWVPLEEVLSMFGAKAAAEEPAEEVVAMPAPLAEDSCFDKHPWLLDYLDANPWLPSSGLAGGASVAARKDIAWAEVSDSDAADIFNSGQQSTNIVKTHHKIGPIPASEVWPGDRKQYFSTQAYFHTARYFRF